MGSHLLGMGMQRQSRLSLVCLWVPGKELELYAEGSYIFQEGRSWKWCFWMVNWNIFILTQDRIQLFFPNACDATDQDPIEAHFYEAESTQRVKRKSLWVELHPIPWNKTLALKLLILHLCLNFSSNLGFSTLSGPQSRWPFEAGTRITVYSGLRRNTESQKSM